MWGIHSRAMAWVEKLSSGRYRGIYRDAQGRRRSVGTYAHKPKAQRAAATAEQRARRSLWADPDAVKRPWGQWCDEWWPTRTVEPGTLKVDAGRRRTHLDPRWADVPIGSIRRHDVREWAAWMRRRGVGPSTVQRAVHLLSASLSAAMDAEIIEANPAARLKLPQGGQAQERYLTREEYDALVDELPTVRDQLVVHVLAFTGLRWGEMAGLHRNRLDLDRGRLRVVETFDEKDGSIKAYPKSRRVRSVPVPDWLCGLLGELPKLRGCGLEHTAGRCRSGLVLTTYREHVLRGSNWAAVWRDAVGRAELGHVRIHDLRHTFASWLLQDGIPLAEVGRLMGHVSPSTTQRYAHLAEMPTEAVLSALAAPRLPHGGVLRVVDGA